MLSIETPALMVDREKFSRNCRRMLDRIARSGTAFRIHGKTCKSMAALKACFGSAPASVTASTLDEAEYFFSDGISDIVYAAGMTPEKLERAAALQKRGAGLKIILDDIETAKMIVSRGEALDARFQTLLEIDCDGHRAGLEPDDPEILACARLLTDAGHEVCGTLTHAGSAYELASPSPAAFRVLAKQECDAARKAAALLRSAGFAARVVSAGSTPTALFCEDFSGITEARAGVFMFMDLVMASLNVCATSDIALSVAATVVSRRKRDGVLIADAGWTALSQDGGIASSPFGFGLVCDWRGNLLPGLKVYALNQEHGMIENPHGLDLKPGTRVRILPQHACAAAANFGKFHLCDGDRCVNIWPRING